MLSLSSRRQPQRRTGTSSRSVRRASEKATKVPLSKKCKLDIKRKHLRAAIPGSLEVNSYAVNLQLQIDGENLPDLYKCTIRRHINNKTSCVSYRLQGTGIYNHLRGLYMRGFCNGEEPGVVVLVASSEAAPDLSYDDQSDGDDADGPAAARPAVHDEPASQQEQATQRQRRQPQQRPRKQQQRKRRRGDSDSDYEDEEEAQLDDTEAEQEEPEAAVAGPSGAHDHAYHDQHYGLQLDGGLLAAQQRRTRQRRHSLHSHPVHTGQLTPQGHELEQQQVGLHAHALSGADDEGGALECHEGIDDDGVSALVGSGVEEDVAAAVAEVERRAAQAAAGPGPGPGSHLPPIDPFGHAALGHGLGVGLGGVEALGGVEGLGGGGMLAAAGSVPGSLLDLGPHRDSGPAAALHVGSEPGLDIHTLDGSAPEHAAAALHGSYHAHRDVLDIPLGLSPFSPGLLNELTGRPHPPRGMGHHGHSANAWTSMAPLDFDSNHLAWADSMGLGGLL